MNEAELLILQQARRNRRQSWLLVAMGVFNILVLAYAALKLTGSGAFAGAVAALSVCGVFLVWGYFRLFVLHMTGARAPTNAEGQRIRRVLRPLTAAIALDEPEILIVDDEAYNAFSLLKPGTAGIVAYTTGILKRLDDDQLEAVTAHELSHLANNDTRMAMFSMALVGWALIVFAFGSAIAASIIIFAGMTSLGSAQAGGCLGILFALLVIALMIALAVISFAAWSALLCWLIAAKAIDSGRSRQREWLADATAAWITRNPLALATALERINGSELLERGQKATYSLCFANPAQKLLGISFHTHPPIQQRIERLRAIAAVMDQAEGAAPAEAK